MKKLDLTGQRFGKLTPIKVKGASKSGSLIWLCRCDCGKETRVASGNLRARSTKSCGCSRHIRPLGCGKKHGLSNSRVYNIWRGMIARCSKPKTTHYKYYGGKGLKVCDRWSIFQNFIDDMGIPENNQSIDRIDGSKGYFKENCRWVTSMQQMSNTKKNHFLTFNGETLHISGWARKIGMNKRTLLYRIESGWSIKRALTEPLNSSIGKNQYSLRDQLKI